MLVLSRSPGRQLFTGVAGLLLTVVLGVLANPVAALLTLAGAGALLACGLAAALLSLESLLSDRSPIRLAMFFNQAIVLAWAGWLAGGWEGALLLGGYYAILIRSHTASWTVALVAWSAWLLGPWGLLAGGAACVLIVLSLRRAGRRDVAGSGRLLDEQHQGSSWREQMLWQDICGLAERLRVRPPRVWLQQRAELVPSAAIDLRGKDTLMLPTSWLEWPNRGQLSALLAHELGHAQRPVYGWLTFLWWLANPVALAGWLLLALSGSPYASQLVSVYPLLWLLWVLMARQEEYRADRLAAETVGASSMFDMLSALDARARLMPRWQRVWMMVADTHPSTSRRLRALRKIGEYQGRPVRPPRALPEGPADPLAEVPPTVTVTRRRALSPRWDQPPRAPEHASSKRS